MRNPLLDRIDNYKFSIRICRLAKNNGIKTVGKMMAWAYQNKDSRVLEELVDYTQEYQNKYFEG